MIRSEELQSKPPTGATGSTTFHGIATRNVPKLFWLICA